MMCAPAILAVQIEVLTAEDVQRIVGRVFGVTISDLTSPSRSAHLSWARHVAIYLVREILGFSFPRTAICFKRDHTKAIHSCNRVLARMAKEAQFGALVERLKRECR